MKYGKVFLIILAFAIFIAACNETKKTNITNSDTAVLTTSDANSAQTPAALSNELIAAKGIYNEKCARCHKEDGSGGKVDLEGATFNAENLTTAKMKKMEDAKYIKYIENGIPDEGMPAFKGRLSDDQIKDVVKYIRAEFQK